MRDVPRIKAAYEWMLRAYERDTSAALEAGDDGAGLRLEHYRDSLERGLFVVLFGQFERHVTQTFETARDKRAESADWRSRRGWDVPALSDRRVTFETKLALVLDRRSPAYRRVMRAYALRNHLAHGGMTEPVGSIEEFVEDLFAWQSGLSG